MNTSQTIFKALGKCGFKVSTDTRENLFGSIFFALKGESFDGNKFVSEAIEKGALGAVSTDPEITGDNIYQVDNTLKALQEVARKYRKLFDVPIIAIGGSNGKTTSRDLMHEILKTKYKVFTTKRNLNNEIGLPLSILSMDKKAQLGVFEIGANHPHEHLDLLEILDPTMVIVTNNGLDHLEGFGSPQGVRMANKEIYDWALSNGSKAFVNKNNPDLIEDSQGLETILYPDNQLSILNSMPLTIKSGDKEFKTNLIGDFNLENIELALAVGKYFDIKENKACQAVSRYWPRSNRSQFLKINNTSFVIDCYNANPSSMKLSLKSFTESAKHPRGIILGDMLELGTYSNKEHKKIVERLSEQKFDSIILIGKEFKKALAGINYSYNWFPDSETTREWFSKQDFKNYIFLLKGSRGMKVEEILE